jgi:hypothetical protein
MVVRSEQGPLGPGPRLSGQQPVSSLKPHHPGPPPRIGTKTPVKTMRIPGCWHDAHFRRGASLLAIQPLDQCRARCPGHRNFLKSGATHGGVNWMPGWAPDPLLNRALAASMGRCGWRACCSATETSRGAVLLCHVGLVAPTWLSAAAGSATRRSEPAGRLPVEPGSLFQQQWAIKTGP